MPQFNFPKNVRLLKSAQFDRVFDGRCSFADGFVVVYFAPSEAESDRPRLGLVVSRKCGNAVVRNRWKRALREAFRLVQHGLPRQMDLVVLPRRGAKPEVACLQRSLQQLAKRGAKKLGPKLTAKLTAESKVKLAAQSALDSSVKLAPKSSS